MYNTTDAYDLNAMLESDYLIFLSQLLSSDRKRGDIDLDMTLFFLKKQSFYLTSNEI